MPPLAGFSDNAFRTHTDIVTAAFALLKPLAQYKSLENARIKIATASGAGFSETAAQLEGFARPLWVVPYLMNLQTVDEVRGLSFNGGQQLATWVNGLKAGTNPNSTEYWGDLVDCDQRMVEMESIALSLLSAPEAFGFPNDETARDNLVSWLMQINSHKMPLNNWRWFRVFVNLALIKSLGVPQERLQAHIDADFAMLDSFYLAEGWSSDGPWGDDSKQADYYSGSFAIQFSQLLFVKYAANFDPERTERYRKQAKEFSVQYWRYFDQKGAAIPFGRSLTYRFAFAAFWAAVTLADVELPVPINCTGAVKGLLLRHMRWWSRQSDIFNTDGSLNIGYTYPNMYMSEDYNSPQSVYWCLKSFVILGVAYDGEFWAAEETAHPMEVHHLPHVKLIEPPKHIMCNTPEHHFLLSSSQSTRKDHKSREAKYSKFAYSSAFGFSVSIGPTIEQTAPDSVLCVSLDDGDTWKVRWEPFSIIHKTLRHDNEDVPILVSSWKPWQKLDILIETRLIPPLQSWPGWHLRIHTVKSSRNSFDSLEAEKLRLVDSGFAISAQTSKGHSIFERPILASFQIRDFIEGYWRSNNKSLVISEAGASGVIDLTKTFLDGTGDGRNIRLTSQSEMVRANANTNLMSQRTLIPAAHHVAGPQKTDLFCNEGISFTVVTGVFAVEQAKVNKSDTWKFWDNPPTGKYEVDSGILQLNQG